MVQIVFSDHDIRELQTLVSLRNAAVEHIHSVEHSLAQRKMYSPKIEEVESMPQVLNLTPYGSGNTFVALYYYVSEMQAIIATLHSMNRIYLALSKGKFFQQVDLEYYYLRMYAMTTVADALAGQIPTYTDETHRMFGMLDLDEARLSVFRGKLNR